MCNRNVGGSSRYLVSCFQQCFWENIFKFLTYEGVEAYYVFRSSSFLLTNYFFLIFKVSVTQSATWVIFTELIWTSLIQICIYLPRLLWSLEGWFQNESMGCNSTIFPWKIKFSLQQKEGSNDLVGPKYYASSVGVPCCHCRMDKSFFKKALRYHTKKKFSGQILSGKYFSRKEWLNQIKQNRKKSLCQDYGRLECVALTNHLYSHSSRSVPSNSYM